LALLCATESMRSHWPRRLPERPTEMATPHSRLACTRHNSIVLFGSFLFLIWLPMRALGSGGPLPGEALTCLPGGGSFPRIDVEVVDAVSSEKHGRAFFRKTVAPNKNFSPNSTIVSRPLVCASCLLQPELRHCVFPGCRVSPAGVWYPCKCVKET
jgi:hypothetical protein